MNIRNYIFFGLITFFFVACNKEKRYSNKLIKGETWEVKDISVNGAGLGYFGDWKVTSDGSIYDTVPRVNWNYNGQGTVFEWQFQENGKNFQLNYVQLCEECDGDDLSALDSICYNITGNYEAVRHGKNRMEFHSENTWGYSSKKVRVSVERKK